MFLHHVCLLLLHRCFPTFFDSRHPYVVLNIFGSTPNWFNMYKDQGIFTICVPLKPTHGTLVCRGTPVGNHCSTYLFKRCRTSRMTNNCPLLLIVSQNGASLLVLNETHEKIKTRHSHLYNCGL